MAHAFPAFQKEEPEDKPKKRKLADVPDTADVVLASGDDGEYRCVACEEALTKYLNAKDEWTLQDSFLLSPGPPLRVCHKGCRVFLADNAGDGPEAKKRRV